MNDKLALVVGINEYPEGALDCCVADAKQVAAALEMSEYGFTVSLVLDKAATRKRLLQEFEAHRLKKPSVFLFYFAGHGCTTATGTYLVTCDGEPLDEGLELDFFSKILANFSSGGTSTIVVLDCCHSGALTPWPIYARAINQADIENAIPTLSSSRIVLAACRPEQYSYEDSTTGHGLFTTHLLNGLLGDAADHEGIVSVHSLYEYLCKPFEEHTKQTPVFRADVAGRFELAKGLPPRLGKPAGEDLCQSIEREANQFLDEYIAATKVSFGEWKQSGYRKACQTFEPIIRWFENRAHEYPVLNKRERFLQLYASARARLAHLGNVDPGTKLNQGILASQLGEGAFGTVWKVVPEDSAKSALAYKVYHPHDLHITDKISRK